VDPLLLLVALAGYLVGGFPSGVLWARMSSHRDLRREGSGHTGGMNALRVGGWRAGALTVLSDLAKGIVALQLAEWFSPNPWTVPVVGVAAVLGHIWSPYLRFRGGMGLATMAGLMLWLQPLVVIAVGLVWGLAYLVLRHRPRATAVAVPVAGPLLWLLGAPAPVLVLGTVGAIIIALRHVPDLRRHYEPGVL
jgi:acyl phosphate:glycerol-3-phosphate acyltransferase